MTKQHNLSRKREELPVPTDRVNLGGTCTYVYGWPNPLVAVHSKQRSGEHSASVEYKQVTPFKMTIDFYYAPGSSPCRAVLLTAKAIGVDLNLKLMDLMKGEHLSPEFLKINPQHTIPTLVDNGLALSESRAIMTYLVSQYGKDDSLYPKDPRKRAVVDQRLYFDAGTLYTRFADYMYPHLFAGVPLDSAKLDKLKDALKVQNAFLENSGYAAGDKLTVADLSLVATISTFDVAGIDLNPYPNITKWYKNIQKTAPGYEEANGKGAEAFKQMVEHLTKKK